MRQSFRKLFTETLEDAMAGLEERKADAVPYVPGYNGRPLDLLREELGVVLPGGEVAHHEASRYTIEALWQHRFVHERGPRKFSKTYKNSDLVLAFFLEAPSIILLLGPTYQQVIDQQIAGIKKRLREANEWRIKRGKAPIEPHLSERRISFGEHHYIKAISADKAGAVQGYHAGTVALPDSLDRDPSLEEVKAIEAAVREGKASGHRLLVVMDEAPDIRRPLFIALEGAMQGPMAYQLMTGNPTLGAESDHPFAEAGRPGSRFHTIALSHLSTELYPDPYTVDKRFDRGFGTQEEADAGLIPTDRVGKYGLTGWLQDREWIHERERTWGNGSGREAAFKAYVLGQYASVSDSRKVIPLDLILATQDTVPPAQVEQGPHIGVDLAGSGGDRNVAILVVNGYPRASDVWSYAPGEVDKTGQSAKRILALAQKWGAALGPEDGWNGRPVPAEHIHLDDTGNVGVTDWLQGHGHPVDGVDFASSSDERGDWDELLKDHGRFINMRARMHFIVAALLEAGLLAVPDEPQWAELRQEMTWPSWSWTEGGRETRLKVEPKENLRREYGRSPDWLDALMLACCRKPRSRPSFGGL